MTQTVVLIGDPVAHSISPAMQNAAFKALGLDLVYEARRVTRASLGGEFVRLRRDCLGLNVTVPLKEAVIPLLHRMGDAARRAGSVNTVRFAERVASGDSTDGAGFVRALRRAKVRPASAVVLGAGGAARAVAAALADERARVAVWGRDPKRAARLAREVGVEAIAERDLERRIAAADLLVNATPLGGPEAPDALPISSALLREDLAVFDLVYRPRRTRLLREAAARGCRVIEGVEMLIEQGALSLEIWTGRQAPVEVMREAGYAALEPAPARART